MSDRIRAILKENAHLPVNVDTLSDEQSLYDIGMSSHATVNVMLALEDEFEIEFPARLLRRSVFSSIASIRSAINELGSTGAITGTTLAPKSETLNIQNTLRSDCFLDESIYPGAKEPRLSWIVPTRVFLTGATGFLGAFLLVELLEQTSAEILFLVRANSASHGYERLEENLKQYGLWQDDFLPRLRPILGDLALPQFGLNNQHFKELANTIDSIYHNGALVNFSYPYASLQASNVQGTREILRLACHGPLKPVHYISTIYVHNVKQSSVQEDTPLPQDVSQSGGYTQSKWVAEQILSIGRERGIPISIYRPGRITGHSQTGVWQGNDYLWQLIMACLQLRSVPHLDAEFDITPVDYVSQAVIALSLQDQKLGKNFHLINQQPVQLRQLTEWIRSLVDYELDIVPYDLWQEKLVALGRQKQSSMESSLALLLVEAPPQERAQHLPHFDCRHVQNSLKGTNITCPQADAPLLHRYISSFVDRGVIGSVLLCK